MRPAILILAAVHVAVWLVFGFWLIPTVTHIYGNLLGGMDLPWASVVVIRTGWIGCAQFALAGAVLIIGLSYLHNPRWVRVVLVFGVALAPVCACAALMVPWLLSVQPL